MTQTYLLFVGGRRVARGGAELVSRIAHEAEVRGAGPILAFDMSTGRAVDFPIAAPAPAAAEDARRGPGRPKLGVVAREVTLLPRHWEWLARQPGGASVALRKLVEDARKARAGEDAAREARDATYGLMSALCGDRPGFEAASRKLFAADGPGFASEIAEWPHDIRETLNEMAAASFTAPLQA